MAQKTEDITEKCALTPSKPPEQFILSEKLNKQIPVWYSTRPRGSIRISISGRRFECGVEIYTVALMRRPLQKEMQAFSRAIKSLKTKEKYRRHIFFVI